MFPENLASAPRRHCAAVLSLLLLLVCCLAPLRAQDSSSQPQAKPPANQQQTVPEAGGPEGDIGPYSIPKKKDQPPPPEPVRPPKNPPEIGNFSITKDVALVTVPVTVTTANGQFVPHLQEGNFKVYEDGVQQKINKFNVAEAPITAVLLLEFSNIAYPFLNDTLNGAYSFAQQLKPQDWVAVIAYDMKPHILTDFTQDKREVMGALDMLRIPGFREQNLYDALNDTIGRLERIDGRKYIILICTGRDTFSKITYDTILKRIKGTKDITIFAMSTGQAFRIYADAAGAMGPITNLDFLQADNALNTFAKLTGGRAFFPRFEAEMPEDFGAIGASIRNQYVLAYHPTNPNLDGTYRKLKIEVVDPSSGGPLKVVDQKGKPLKITIIAREGYTAKHQVE